MGAVSMAFRVAGWSLEVVAAAMIPALLTDMVAGQPEWRIFGLCIILTAFVGAAMILTAKGQAGNPESSAELRPVILSVLLSAAAVIGASSLPFAFGQEECGWVDAVFESVSQITTTGTTIFPRLSTLPSGLLLWRGTLQWLGGAWALVLGIAVLPFLQVGGMAEFRMDVLAGLAFTQRAKRVVLSFCGLYFALTLTVWAAFWMAGLSAFDACVHAMGVVSTGGATTWSGSLGHFDRTSVDIVAMLGMVAAGLPFPLLLTAAKGNFRPLFNDRQVRWYLGILALSVAVLAVALWGGERNGGLAPIQAAINGAFAAISTVTGSGYILHPDLFWSGFPAASLLFLSTVGGCAGSTTGGLKIFRLQAVFSEIWIQMTVLLHPHAIRAVKRDGWTSYRAVRTQIMGYAFIYTMSFVALTFGLGALGLDTVSALTASVSALANADLKLGAYLGLSGGYGNLPDAAKILLAVGMVLGRVEILPVLVVFTSTFWKR